MDLTKYEDTVRLAKGKCEEKFSPRCDLRLVPSSVTDGVVFAIRVLKPKKPSYMLVGTHGWHMTIPAWEPIDEDADLPDFLQVDVDMRGRAFSTGTPDCNGYELYDVYDAIRFVKREYADYLSSEDVLYFQSGSGGGGNALAIAGKFPDLFAAVNALSPIADYAEWYRFDTRYKEFRDEMDVWIGKTPEDDPEAYAARSGMTLIPNLLSPLLLCHGTTDERVPFYPSRRYLEQARRCGKGDLVHLLALHGVGNRDHYGKATPRQMALMEKRCADNIRSHREPVTLPRAGELIVGGFVVTKAFEVFTDIDRVVVIRYDLDKKELRKVSGTGEITVRWKL